MQFWFCGLDYHKLYRYGRAEAYAMQNPLLSFWEVSEMDGDSAYSVILGVFRELFGSGKILGYSLLRTVNEGGWYSPNGLFIMAPGALFSIAILIWLLRTWKPEQQEKE
jgi:Na+-transporting NADH:ubiquinone oxidoreductase subunit D